MLSILKKYIFFLGFIFLATASFAQASSTADQEIYRINKGEEVNGNLYLTANEIIIDGTLKGDLVAASESIKVSGTITGSLISVAADINVSGVVQGSVRTIAQKLVVSGTVNGDITSVGDRLEIPAAAIIEQSVFYRGNTAEIRGTIRGAIEKSVSAEKGNVLNSEQLYLIVKFFLGIGLLGSILYTFQSTHETQKIWESLRHNFMPNFLWGALYFVVIPLVSLLTLIIPVGRWVGLFGLSFFVIIALISAVDAGYFAAKLLFFRQPTPAKLTVGVFLIGTFLLTVLLSMPILFIIPLVIFLAALGQRIESIRSLLLDRNLSLHD